MVGTDANDYRGKGIPKNAHYWFDIKSEMELDNYGVKFYSAQDLKEFYTQNQQRNKNKGKFNIQQSSSLSSDGPNELLEADSSEDRHEDHINIYELVHYFAKNNPNDLYFLDEVPLIRSRNSMSAINFFRSLIIFFGNLIFAANHNKNRWDLFFRRY